MFTLCDVTVTIVVLPVPKLSDRAWSNRKQL